MSSTLILDFSQRLDNSFINVIFVAKKALEAYFISSAPRLEVVKNFEPLFISGRYSFLIVLNTFLLFDPITILSGYLKSLTASPSLKNSGLEITSNLFLFFFFNIFSISSPVPTGTVDLVIIIFFFLVNFAISLIDLYTKDKSTDWDLFLLGVPTQIKIISDFLIAIDKFVVKINLPDSWFFSINSSKPGSKIVENPELSWLILFMSLSTQ